MGLCTDCFTFKNLMKTVTLSGDGGALRNRRSRMGITLVGLCTDDFTCLDLTFRGYIRMIFWQRWVKYRSDPSTSAVETAFAQDDKLGGVSLDGC